MNRQLECQHTAELFHISDFWDTQGNIAGPPGNIDSSQLDEDIFASSEVLLPALVHVPHLAAADCTVLITGETGTGTELLARAIHKLSYRSSRAFVRINFAATLPQLTPSEQFGRQKDSWFRGMQLHTDPVHLARGGTILLEGLGDLSAEAQIALLRFVQEIESQSTNCDDLVRSNVRLITATSRDLRVAVADGDFRSDLFDRLNGFPVKIPPLRERKEDIPMLIQYFLNRYARRADKTFPYPTKLTMDLLQSYPWPGNMRELQRVMERFVSLYERRAFRSSRSTLLRSSFRSAPLRSLSGELVSDKKELLEIALIEMLAEFRGS